MVKKTAFCSPLSFITFHRHGFYKDGAELNKSFCISILSELYSVDIKKKILEYYTVLACGAPRKLPKVEIESLERSKQFAWTGLCRIHDFREESCIMLKYIIDRLTLSY